MLRILFILILFASCSNNKNKDGTEVLKKNESSFEDHKILLKQYKKTRINSKDTSADRDTYIKISRDSIYYFSQAEKFNGKLFYDPALYWNRLYPYKVYNVIKEGKEALLVFVIDSGLNRVNIWRDLAEGDREYFEKSKDSPY